jgi:hypothetical protein
MEKITPSSFMTVVGGQESSDGFWIGVELW